MFDPNNKFKMNQPKVEDSSNSYFYAADMDLSDPLQSSKPAALRKSVTTSKPDMSQIKATATVAVKKTPASTAKSGDAAYLEYEKFSDKRNELTNAFAQTADIMQKLDMLQLKQKLTDLSDRIKRDTFKVQIVGNFKNGKSTFINSFLGEDVLPAYTLPCTAVINEVKYGPEKRGVIHFKHPLPKTLPNELSPVALKHIKAHLPGRIPPLEVAYDKIEDYVVIPVGKDPKDMLLESPYERVELFWPLELLKNGIEIIDSPGLNEHTTRTKVTMEFLTKSDAIIFVLNATMLCSRDEMTFIEQSLHANGFKDLFFVVNKFDMIPDGEKKRITEYGRKNLVPMTNLDDKGLFFVSAKSALEAKMKGDKNALVKSGMSDFERCLSLFLTKKKGSLKLVSPARAVSNFLQEEALKKILPQHYARLSSTSDEIDKNCEAIQANIKALERKKDVLANLLQMDMKHLSSTFAAMSNANITGTTGYVPQWLMGYEPANKLGFVQPKEKVMATIYELMEMIRMRFEELNRDWCSQQVLPKINERKKAIFPSVKRQVDDLVHSPGSTSVDPFKKFNSRFGTSPGSIGDITLYTALQMTSNSLLGIMAAFSSYEIKERVYALYLRKNSFNLSPMARLKDAVAEEVSACVMSASGEYSETFVNEVVAHFNEAAEKALNPIDDEISSLQNKLGFMSASNGMKQSDIESKKAELQQTEDEIKQLCANLRVYIESFKLKQ